MLTASSGRSASGPSWERCGQQGSIPHLTTTGDRWTLLSIPLASPTSCGSRHPRTGDAPSTFGSVKPLRGAAGVRVVGVVVGLGAALAYGARVPRPAISLPPGDTITSVEGTCGGGGSETCRCETGESGVRSLLTVETDRARSEGESLLRATLARDGFRPSAYGVDSKGFSSNGVPVDADPLLLCRSTGGPEAGCLGLVSWSADTYGLAWYPGR